MTGRDQKEGQSAEPAPEQESLGRRDALFRMGRWLIGVSGIAFVVGTGRFLRSGAQAGEPSTYPIGRLSDFRMGTLTWLRKQQIFVMRDESGLSVFSARCTHLGCIVRRTSEGFICPCHGARYDAKGTVLHGPANRSLPRYHAWLEADGRIWVDVSHPAEDDEARLKISQNVETWGS